MRDGRSGDLLPRPSQRPGGRRRPRGQIPEPLPTDRVRSRRRRDRRRGAVAEVASIIDRVQTTGSVVTLVLCASLAFVLVAAAKIVTVYEIVQGLMRYLMSLYLALGIGLVYVGSVLILFTTVDALASERFTPDPQLRSTAVAAGGGMIGLGVLLSLSRCSGSARRTRSSPAAAHVRRVRHAARVPLPRPLWAGGVGGHHARRRLHRHKLPRSGAIRIRRVVPLHPHCPKCYGDGLSIGHLDPAVGDPQRAQYESGHRIGNASSGPRRSAWAKRSRASMRRTWCTLGSTIYRGATTTPSTM